MTDYAIFLLLTFFNLKNYNNNQAIFNVQIKVTNIQKSDKKKTKWNQIKLKKTIFSSIKISWVRYEYFIWFLIY